MSRWDVLVGACAAAACGAAPLHAAEPPLRGPAAYAATLKREADAAGLPPDIADAVMAVESGYDPTRVGGVGEIGLMQVRPQTASMLGFSGSVAELATPEINIHYGVIYLAGAWRQANGDLCRALMKYRAGHGQETMSPRSVEYCARARSHLAQKGSIFAAGTLPLAVPADRAGQPPASDALFVAQVDPHLKGRAFWAAHEARIRAISARLAERWRRMAAR